MSGERLISRWCQYITDRKEHGAIAIWGAASKGLTLHCQIHESFEAEMPISCAIDLNQSKQGCFMPVTGITIMSPEQAMTKNVGTIIVMNPNYLSVIAEMIKEMNWSAEIAGLND